VGRLTYYKGHRYLIEAIKDLPNVRLELVGEGELRSDIEKQIQKLGLGERVKLLGRLSDHDVNRAIARCDILCLPSIERTEAFGVVILEAARLGKPALVSDVKGSGMSWVVEQHKTGWVVKAQSAETIRAIFNTQMRVEVPNHFGQNARRRLEETYIVHKLEIYPVQLENRDISKHQQ
jgi:rhamnosyl/mannosyltransferase